MAPIRLDALLSRYGYCSRSEAKAWLRAGRVTLEGQPLFSPSEKARPDAVRVDGEPVEAPGGLLALLHKPQGCVCSHDVAEGPSVYDLLPLRWRSRNPQVTTVGRLDKDASGALLITDVGEWVHRWTSPKHKVTKRYAVSVEGELRQEMVTLFAAGTLLLEGEDKPCLPAVLRIHSSTQAELEIVEGRYHQVKRMFASQGCMVTRLHRASFGPYELNGLAPGEWRMVEPAGLG